MLECYLLAVLALHNRQVLVVSVVGHVVQVPVESVCGEVVQILEVVVNTGHFPLHREVVLILYRSECAALEQVRLQVGI